VTSADDDNIIEYVGHCKAPASAPCLPQDARESSVSRETVIPKCSRQIVSRESFANTEFRKDHAKQILHVDMPRDPPESLPGKAKVFRAYIQAVFDCVAS
jgi:hypothetical protein